MVPYFAGRARYQDPPAHQTPQRPSLPLPMIFEPAARQRWEYRVVVVDPREEEPLGEERAAELGADGWLLAAVVQIPGERWAGKLHYYFVRTAE